MLRQDQIKDRIIQLCEERGMTKYNLANRTKLGERTIYNIFEREGSPSLTTLYAICEALDVTMAEFFSDSQDQIVASEEEKKLLTCYRSITVETHRELAVDTVEKFARMQK